MVKEINEMIISLNFKEFKVVIKNVEAKKSYKKEVIMLVILVNQASNHQHSHFFLVRYSSLGRLYHDIKLLKI